MRNSDQRCWRLTMSLYVKKKRRPADLSRLLIIITAIATMRSINSKGEENGPPDARGSPTTSMSDKTPIVCPQNKAAIPDITLTPSLFFLLLKSFEFEKIATNEIRNHRNYEATLAMRFPSEVLLYPRERQQTVQIFNRTFHCVSLWYEL